MPIRTSKHWGTLSLAKLKAMGGLIDTETPKGRGRPKIQSIGQLGISKSGGWALSVFDEMFRLGNVRGSQRQAIKNVARRQARFTSESAVKQAVKRHLFLKIAAQYLYEQKLLVNELQRRTAGFPDDIRAKVIGWDSLALLELLRAEDIDGKCPETWVRELRRAPD